MDTKDSYERGWVMGKKFGMNFRKEKYDNLLSLYQKQLVKSVEYQDYIGVLEAKLWKSEHEGITQW